MTNIIEATNKLKAMLLDENLKIPDKDGSTLLINKAKKNSELSPLSPEKKFEEDVVCKLVQYFNEFTQINFSELESYIIVSNFSLNNIVESFEEFVKKIEESEDIIFKACVARLLQILNQNCFPLSYILNRFEKLKKLDPWLLSELAIACNWNEGVKMIKEQLKLNYDASYLFSMLPTWMKDVNNQKKISFALSEWYDELKPEDRELARYYAQNYGFLISSREHRTFLNETNYEVIQDILQNKSFVEFKKKKSEPKFVTLSPC